MQAMITCDQTIPPLPENWTPSERDVVVGKGKKWYLHPGNVMLRDFVASILADYSKAHSKTGKSEIISDVVEHVKKTGSFVKRHPVTGKWMYAEERLCREKCSQTFRDALHETYKSSSVAKKNKRRREKEETKFGHQLGVPSTTMANENKRMRLLERPVQPAVLPSIPANLFDLDMPFSSKSKAMRRGSLSSQGGENLFSLLNDMLTTQRFEEDGNPFEPTPLPDNNVEYDCKIDPTAISSMLDLTSSVLDLTDTVLPYNGGVDRKEDEWKLMPLSFESGMGEMRFSGSNPRRETIPTASISAAFAA